MWCFHESHIQYVEGTSDQVLTVVEACFDEDAALMLPLGVAKSVWTITGMQLRFPSPAGVQAESSILVGAKGYQDAPCMICILTLIHTHRDMYINSQNMLAQNQLRLPRSP